MWGIDEAIFGPEWGDDEKFMASCLFVVCLLLLCTDASEGNGMPDRYCDGMGWMDGFVCCDRLRVEKDSVADVALADE